MTISADTKISALLKQNPDALEAIVSISPKFSKLRNPVLRKLIAGRTSIAMASKIGGCNVTDFFNKLRPLGFEIDQSAVTFNSDDERKPIPEFLKDIQLEKLVELDVRPVIETGKDPLNIIMQKVNALERGCVLKIINSFEPTPLMHLLGKQGFESYSEPISDELVHTYFYKQTDKVFGSGSNGVVSTEGWDDILNRFQDRLVTIDVRKLEMPLPMHTILEALDTLPADKALFVYHKRVPVFLLPELEDRQFNYRIREIKDEEVQLLIYKN